MSGRAELAEKMAANTYPDSYTKHRGQEGFLTPEHPEYDAVVATSYRGFEKKPAPKLMPKFTSVLASALATVHPCPRLPGSNNSGTANHPCGTANPQLAVEMPPPGGCHSRAGWFRV